MNVLRKTFVAPYAAGRASNVAMRAHGTDKLIATTAPAATVLIRLLVGWVFLSEGVQKFLFPATLGVGRFAKIGIPWPGFSAPFDGVFEIGCGVLILLGLLTRVAAIPLLVDISVAILSTKIPMLLHKGFWATAHEARTDFSMLFGLLFLLLQGGGAWSADALWARHTAGGSASRPASED